MAEKFYGENCPVGKVQIQFVGVSPVLRVSDYTWKPCNDAFLEIFVDGQRYRIDVGDFEASSRKVGSCMRRGLHINGPFDMRVDKHSVNAMDIYTEERPFSERRRPPFF